MSGKFIAVILIAVVLISSLVLTSCSSTATASPGAPTSTTSTAAKTSTTVAAVTSTAVQTSASATSTSVSPHPLNAVNYAAISTTLLVPVAKDSDKNIHLGYVGSSCEAYFYVADALGLYKKYNLNVNLDKVGGTNNLSLLSTGKIDVTDFVVEQALKPISEGLQIKFTINAMSGCFSSIIKPDAPYKSWKDLKGKSIGIAGAVGGAGMNYAYDVIAYEGLDPTSSDFHWKPYADSASLLIAFEKGEVDVVVGGDATNYKEVNAGKAKFFSYMATDAAYKGQGCCLLAFNSDYIKNHPDTAKAFSAAIYEASLWVGQHTEQAADILVNGGYVAGTVPDVLQLIKTYGWNPGYNIGYKTLVEASGLFAKTGIIDKSTDPVKLTDSLMVKFNELLGQ
jgi:NitT/TauT family transport system substrate-binding protein